MTPYPLSWPEILPRTNLRASSSFKTSLSQALQNVEGSLRLFGRDTRCPVTNVVQSSNVSIGVNKPSDPGVAVWFTWDGAQRVIAVDRYPTPAENLQAIHYILEARRTELRHGGLHIVRQTFKGFIALPAPKMRNWRDVLGFGPEAVTAEMVKNQYRKTAKDLHEKGASESDFVELNMARDTALESL